MVRVHLHVEAIHSLESVVILFLKVGHLEEILLDFFRIVIRAQLLITLRVLHKSSLEGESSLSGLESAILIVSTILEDLGTLLFEAAAPVVARKAEEKTPAFAVGFWQNLIQVEAKEGDPDAVDGHHDEAVCHCKVVVL